MSHALRLGRRNLGQTWPNPSVGCVIVKNNRLIGQGVTGRGGRPHAERQALDMAGPAAQNATAYVTLEPCAHIGQTPPCAKGLAEAGITRVVSAIEDPDPRVAGRGHDMLRAAGIKVSTGIRSDEAAFDHAGFFLRQTAARPFVTLKLASTIDGKIATSSGESKWITGAQARHHVHLLRAQHDAILIGSGTALADDPALDVRLQGLEDRSPIAVLLDRRLRVSDRAQLYLNAAKRPLWVLHAPELKPDVQSAARFIAADQAPLTASGALRHLAHEGITRLFVEGGAKIAAAFLQENLVDQLIIFQSGHVFGQSGRSAVDVLPDQKLSDYPQYRLYESTRLGNDICLTYRRQIAA